VKRRVASVRLRSLPVGAKFYPPRLTARRVAVHRVWGRGVNGSVFVRAFERIVVHSRCKHWIAEAKAYSFKVDERSGDILPVIVDKDNNAIDATRYALAPLIRRRKSAFAPPPAKPTRTVRALRFEVPV